MQTETFLGPYVSHFNLTPKLNIRSQVTEVCRTSPDIISKRRYERVLYYRTGNPVPDNIDWN